MPATSCSGPRVLGIRKGARRGWGTAVDFPQQVGAASMATRQMRMDSLGRVWGVVTARASVSASSRDRPVALPGLTHVPCCPRLAHSLSVQLGPGASLGLCLL